MCSMFREHGYEVRKLVSIGWPFLLRNHSNDASHIMANYFDFDFDLWDASLLWFQMNWPITGPILAR